MAREVKNLTNIKLTESDEDGIWLHFECDGEKLKTGIALSSLVPKGDIAKRVIETWAREQLDKQETTHREPLPPGPRNEFLKEGNEERTDKPGKREVNGSS